MRSLLLLAAIVLSAVPAFAETKASDPVDVIRRHDRELQSLLKRYQPGNHAQRDTLKRMVNEMFSFQELGKRALGKTWLTLKKPDQDTFVAVFKRAVEASSIKRLEAYRADSTHYSVSGTVVTAVVWRGGKSSTVIYKMFQQGGNWQAWDLILEDVSSLRTYKDQFSAIIAKDGFPEVVRRLRAKGGD